MLIDDIIVFFYVDNIVFCYRKRDEGETHRIIQLMQERYQLNILGKLKWFLGIHVLRDRQQKKLWLSQKAFIEKIANQYGIDIEGRMPDTPMTEVKLLLADTRVDVVSALRYQHKMGSLLYAAIMTRPDVAFAVSRLARFNRNPTPTHHEAVDRVIHYLYGSKHMAICYGGDAEGSGAQAFICASNTFFADNSIDRKSSQGYIMMLFNSAISWRANKQDTVTMLGTEAELLALSQTAKEGIFLS
jgi:hypothetical protein